MTAQPHAAAPAPHTYFGYADPAVRPVDTLEDSAQALRALGCLLANFDDNCVLDRDTLTGVDLIMQAVARQIAAIAPLYSADIARADYPRFKVDPKKHAQGDVWHTLEEYAEMGLPGLPKTSNDGRWLAIVRD